MRSIDLNADVGEGYDDRALFPFLTSVNVACGGHAGDGARWPKVVRDAAAFGLALGAHPSYPDREHFGRREMAMRPLELGRVGAQPGGRVARDRGCCGRATGARQAPRRALQHRRARPPHRSGRRARGWRSRSDVAARRTRRLAASRGGAGNRPRCRRRSVRRPTLRADGSLAPRALDRALIRDAEEAADQAERIVREHEVVAVDGTRVGVRADTLCIHGDTDGAAAIAAAVRRRLEKAGIVVARL